MQVGKVGIRTRLIVTGTNWLDTGNGEVDKMVVGSCSRGSSRSCSVSLLVLSDRGLERGGEEIACRLAGWLAG